MASISVTLLQQLAEEVGFDDCNSNFAKEDDDELIASCLPCNNKRARELFEGVLKGKKFHKIFSKEEIENLKTLDYTKYNIQVNNRIKSLITCPGEKINSDCKKSFEKK